MINFKCPNCFSKEIGSSSSAEENTQWTQCFKCKETYDDEYVKGYWDGVETVEKKLKRRK